MGLSSDLISQFVKATNDKEETKNESKVNGTIVEYNGSKYVKLDGSELLTPIDTTVAVSDGERVTVTIKDHTATVDGNVTSPSAKNSDVETLGTKISDFEIVVADKVSTKEFDAEVGRIDELVSDNAIIKDTLTASNAEIENLKAKDVEIDGKLTADEAEIEKLKSTKIDAEIVEATYATIENLDATNAEINNLEATYGEFQELTTKNFEAVNADIKNLDAEKIDANVVEAKYATIDNLEANYATITQLEATNANVGNLQADVADIDTLIFGSASGTTIQTSFANAVIAQLGNAQIKSAMIESLSADKINTGTLNTNNISVQSDDGKLLISDETIQISDENRVRVQIGKDASGDYSINIWDAEGELMFSEGGITDSAIKEAIIRNDMVSENANIAASKLDISSLFKEINDSTETINAGKILMDADGQTLNVAFTSMTTELSVLEIAANKAQATADEAKANAATAADNLSKAEQNLADVTSRVGSTEEEIAAAQKAVDEAKTVADKAQEDADAAQKSANEAQAAADKNAEDITKLDDKVTSQGTEITVIQGQISSKIWQQDIDTATDELGNDISTLNDQYSSLEQTVDGLSSMVGQHTTQIAGKADNSTVTAVSSQVSSLKQTVEGLESTVSKNTTTIESKADSSTVTTINTQVSELKQTVEGLESTVSKNTTDIESKADGGTVTAVSEQVSKLSSDLSGFKSTVSNTYATKTDLNTVDDKADAAKSAADAAQKDADALETRMTTAESSITQNADAIALRVTTTEMSNTLSGYYTKTETDSAVQGVQDNVDDISDGLSTNYYTKSETDSAITTQAGLITSSVEEKYVMIDEFGTEYEKLERSTIEQTKEELSVRFENIEKSVSDNQQDNSDRFAEIDKYFTFNDTGLTITSDDGTNKIELVLDSGLISFRKNGEQFGWWDGVDFYTGNVVIDVQERAQFGNFAYVPRSDGSLSFLKVGD